MADFLSRNARFSLCVEDKALPPTPTSPTLSLVDAALVHALYIGPGVRGKLLGLRAAALRGDVAVVTDFDRTLTSSDSDECHTIMQRSPSMPPSFRCAMDALMDFTLPETVALSADAWWGRANALLLSHGWNASMLGPTVEAAHLKPRLGLSDFFDACSAGDTPIIVVSAGFTDIIERFLGSVPRAATAPGGRRVTDVVVLANKMALSSNGDLVGWEPKSGPAHSHNKDLVLTQSLPLLAGRRSWLVLGDKPHDAAVAGSASSGERAVVAVGFFDAVSDDPRYGLEDYARAFDIVLPAAASRNGGGADLAPLADLLRP